MKLLIVSLVAVATLAGATVAAATAHKLTDDLERIEAEINAQVDSNIRVMLQDIASAK